MIDRGKLELGRAVRVYLFTNKSCRSKQQNGLLAFGACLSGDQREVFGQWPGRGKRYSKVEMKPIQENDLRHPQSVEEHTPE